MWKVPLSGFGFRSSAIGPSAGAARCGGSWTTTSAPPRATARRRVGCLWGGLGACGGLGNESVLGGWATRKNGICFRICFPPGFKGNLSLAEILLLFPGDLGNGRKHNARKKLGVAQKWAISQNGALTWKSRQHGCGFLALQS